MIDDGDCARDIIRVFFEKDGFEVCGEAADGVEAIEQAKKLQPDLIVLDLAMPRMNGVEAASILSATMPDVPIVLLTLYQNLFGTTLASAVGVKAIIDKTDAMNKSVECIHFLLKTSKMMRYRSTVSPGSSSPIGLWLRPPFRIFRLQSDGGLHFVEAMKTFDDAKGRVRDLGEVWPGEYVIDNEETGERLFVSTRDETTN